MWIFSIPSEIKNNRVWPDIRWPDVFQPDIISYQKYDYPVSDFLKTGYQAGNPVTGRKAGYPVKTAGNLPVGN